MNINEIQMDMYFREQDEKILNYHINLLYEYTQTNHYQDLFVIKSILNVINQIIDKKIKK